MRISNNNTNFNIDLTKRPLNWFIKEVTWDSLIIYVETLYNLYIFDSKELAHKEILDHEKTTVVV